METPVKHYLRFDSAPVYLEIYFIDKSQQE